MYITIFRSFGFVFFGSISITAIASVLQIPRDFATIQSALNSATAGDTVLLAPGSYREHITLIHDITIASQWITTADTIAIAHTVWLNDSLGILITPSGQQLKLIGLTLTSSNHPDVGRGILNGILQRLELRDCRLEGTFDTTLGTRYVINLQNADLLVSNCAISSDSTNFETWLNASNTHYTRLVNVVSYGRNDGSSFLLFGGGDSISVVNCNFLSKGKGLWLSPNIWFRIDSCTFKHLNSDALVLVNSNSQTQSWMRNCLFDSCNASYNPWNLISLTVGATSAFFENCSFKHIYSNIGTIIHGNPYIRKCLFRDNQVVGSILLSGVSRYVDSCAFIGNNSSCGLVGFWNGTDSLRFTNCDVIGNSCGLFFSRTTTWGPPTTPIDSVIAPNCYWGDPSGPQYAGNPNGAGASIGGNVYPIPWRTTPVFPTTGVSDRTISYSLPNEFSLQQNYPNPFNSTTTISFSLPHTSPVNLTIFDDLGREVTSLLSSQSFTAGTHLLSWNAATFPSGTYFLRMNAGTFTQSRKLLLLK